jgi:hypothetical protein
MEDKPSFQARLRYLISKVPSALSIGARGTYFGKLLDILLKRAKVDGCKPSFKSSELQ